MMEKHILFLRGINVGGHKKIKMADLRTLLEKDGFENVRTYIQSGNIVLQTTEAQDLGHRVSRIITKQYGFEVPAIALKPFQIEQLLDACPFSEEKKQKSYFALLFEAPEEALVRSLQSMTYPGEEFYIGNRCVYLHYALGAGKAKLTNNLIERKLKVVATARNFNTMQKMIDLATS